MNRTRCGFAFQGESPASLAANCVKQGSRPCTLWIAGQIRAAQQGHLDLSLDDEREGDRVLLFSQKAFRAIDWIERPKPRHVFFLRSAVDPGTGFLAASFNADALEFGQNAVEKGAVFFTAKRCRFFLTDDRVVRKGRTKSAADNGLA